VIREPLIGDCKLSVSLKVLEGVDRRSVFVDGINQSKGDAEQATWVNSLLVVD
jgi:hypothetical protein